jgi:hypothetical protein
MISVVYATNTQVVNTDSGPIRVPKGSHWPADDPVVAAMPALFSSDPRWGMLYTVEPDGYDAPVETVETATAAPGERRSVRRG